MTEPCDDPDAIRFDATPYHLSRCVKPIGECQPCSDHFGLIQRHK